MISRDELYKANYTGLTTRVIVSATHKIKHDAFELLAKEFVQLELKGIVEKQLVDYYLGVSIKNAEIDINILDYTTKLYDLLASNGRDLSIFSKVTAMFSKGIDDLYIRNDINLCISTIRLWADK